MLCYKMALFNFECHQNTELKRRAAKSATFCCYKKCTLVVINERDYIKTDNDDNCVVQKTTSKTGTCQF